MQLQNFFPNSRWEPGDYEQLHTQIASIWILRQKHQMITDIIKKILDCTLYENWKKILEQDDYIHCIVCKPGFRRYKMSKGWRKMQNMCICKKTLSTLNIGFPTFLLLLSYLSASQTHQVSELSHSDDIPHLPTCLLFL